MQKPPLRIGLTGGIGSGKSTVAHVLVACGAALIDADAISRQLTASGGAAIGALAKQFGAEIINAQGAMDRDRMRRMAFADAAVRQQLEAIVHPLVRREFAQQASAATAAGHACIVFDIPLLVESGRWRQQLDRVVVVDCSPSTQLARVMERDGLPREAVEKIIASQATRGHRLAAADACICNDGLSLPALQGLARQMAICFGL